MIVQLLKEFIMPAGKFPHTGWNRMKVSKTPFENVPPLGNAPFQTGPPTESAMVMPFVSLKLYRRANDPRWAIRWSPLLARCWRFHCRTTALTT